MADTLNADQQLVAGEKLTSSNGKYTLVLEESGLVGYGLHGVFWRRPDINPPPDKKPVRAVMQQDSNFVLYTATDEPLWHTKTSEHNLAGCRLVLQDDRNIVIYKPDNTHIWAAGTERWAVCRVLEAGAQENPDEVAMLLEVVSGDATSAGWRYARGRNAGAVLASALTAMSMRSTVSVRLSANDEIERFNVRRPEG